MEGFLVCLLWVLLLTAEALTHGLESLVFFGLMLCVSVYAGWLFGGWFLRRKGL